MTVESKLQPDGHAVKSRTVELARRPPTAALLIIGVAVCAVILASPRRAGAFSDASLDGTYVFRASGHSLFGPPDQSAPTPVYVSAVGYIVFDGGGHLTGTDTTSGTETFASGAGVGSSPYSSQVVCNMRMSGTYKVKRDGQGTMTINFVPIAAESACGSSTGTFTLVLASPNLAEFVSTGQSMADPDKGAFFAYVVDGEIKKAHTSGE